jgi:hypothetical protein
MGGNQERGVSGAVPMRDRSATWGSNPLTGPQDGA